ncbi:MAG: putative ABC transport system permease protein [Cellvibrionaceae bacterium]|jgi:putative ABC transport system permease protein
MSTQNNTSPSSGWDARPRWRKVLLDLWENRSRTALVVVSIAVGVFALGTIITAYIILAEDMQVSYSAVSPANIEFNIPAFDQGFVDTIAKVDGLDKVEGRHRAVLRISQDNGSTWRGLIVIGMEDFNESEIFVHELIEGESIPGRREILLENRIRETLDVAIGDVLLVQLANGTTREMPVAGFVQDQGVRGGPNADPHAYVTLASLEWMGRDSSFNQILATVEGDPNDIAHIEEVADRVEERLKKRDDRVFRRWTGTTREHPMESTVLAILGVLGAMGGLMLLLGSSLIANTLSALLSQHLRQIGVMKLIGAHSFQIVGMYLMLILSFSFLALAVSIPLSSYGGYALASYLANLLAVSLQGFRFIPASIITQLLIAILVPLASAFIPVRSGARTTVSRAISNTVGGESGGGNSVLDRIGESIAWLSRPVLLSIRNTFRKRGRLALTLFTLTMAGAIFIAVFNVRESLNEFIDSIGNLFIADVIVDMDRPYRTDRVTQIAMEVPGVEFVEPWLAVSGEVQIPGSDSGESVTFLAPPAESELVKPRILAGRWLNTTDTKGIVIADNVLKVLPDLKPGDSIPIKLSGDREELWLIIGIFAFPDPNGETILAYAPYDIIAPITGFVGQGSSFRILTRNHSIASQELAAKQLNDRLDEAGFSVSNIEAGKATTASAADAIGVLVTFFMTMALLTAVVGSIGLAGTMSMNVLERTREIGVMRAIGAVDNEIMRSVILEGLSIGFISWVLGAVLSFPISYGLLSIVSDAMINSPLPLYFSVQGFWIWLIGVLVLATIASIIPARNAARLTIREVLAYE